jgi:hypothetical protein
MNPNDFPSYLMQDDNANYANARSPLGGKKSAVLTLRVTDEMKFDLERRAHECGMAASEYIERVLAINLYGLQHVVESERARTEKVCGVFTAKAMGVA